MLSPSDFNNAVPQFTNGNYASNPINPQYIAEPDAENYNRGTEPLQTLPAQWWNWFLNKFTARFNKVNIYVKNIFNELAQVLSIFNITPDGTEQTPTTSQLKTVFETCYPQYVKTAANLVGTETTVNGHPLSSNVTVTRSDLGLGTSATVNTGTAVGCIPTVGTALGTTNNNILVTDSTGKLKPSGITVGTAAGCDATLFARKTEVDALYGNTVPTALGTAAVGTCTTFARSDHVHPDTDIIKGNLKCGYYGIMINGSDGYECGGVHPSSFLRSPYYGFIPYCSAENGIGCIGTEGWPFADVYAKNFHGTFNGNATSATSANYATCADQLKIGGAGYSTWAWSGQNGQPGWLWGSNDGVNMFVWDPANFSVNYARYSSFADRVCMRTLTQCEDCGTYYFHAAGCTFIWAATPIMYWDNLNVDSSCVRAFSTGGRHLISNDVINLNWNYIEL